MVVQEYLEMTSQITEVNVEQEFSSIEIREKNKLNKWKRVNSPRKTIFDWELQKELRTEVER